MHKAAERGDLKIIEFLLSNGAKVDSRTHVSVENHVMYFYIIQQLAVLYCVLICTSRL